MIKGSTLLPLRLLFLLAISSVTWAAGATISGVALLAAGKKSGCVIDATGKAKCWGNGYGYGGTGTEVAPAGMGTSLRFDGNEVSAISNGKGNLACVVFSSGDAQCWGSNEYGQCGQGSTAAVYSPRDSTPPVNLGFAATHVTCGSVHACALLSTEQVKCWGDNSAGELGLGIEKDQIGTHNSEMGKNLPILNLGTGVTVTKIQASLFFTCALLGPTPMIKCWGSNENGQLGIGSTIAKIGTSSSQMGDSLAAVNLGTGITPLDFAMGVGFVCSIVTAFALKCWGDNTFSQLGLTGVANFGTTAASMGDNLPFVDLGTGVTVIRISAGDWHACALTNHDQIKCWGKNIYGELGLGVNTPNIPNAVNQMGDNLPFVQMGSEYSVIGISLGTGFSCAILNNQKVKCWGNNRNGELGICSTTVSIGTEPSQMGNNLEFVDDCISAEDVPEVFSPTDRVAAFLRAARALSTDQNTSLYTVLASVFIALFVLRIFLLFCRNRQNNNRAVNLPNNQAIRYVNNTNVNAGIPVAGSVVVMAQPVRRETVDAIPVAVALPSNGV